MIKKGQKISLEYSVFLDDGTKIDSNVGEQPLTFVLGSHAVFPALEQALTALDVGQQKEILLAPEDAYGPIVNEAFREVDIEIVPATFRHEGAVLGVQDPAGGVFPIRVHEVKEKKIILDFNHPLAGKALRFDVKVVAIN